MNHLRGGYGTLAAKGIISDMTLGYVSPEKFVSAEKYVTPERGNGVLISQCVRRRSNLHMN